MTEHWCTDYDRLFLFNATDETVPIFKGGETAKNPLGQNKPIVFLRFKQLTATNRIGFLNPMECIKVTLIYNKEKINVSKIVTKITREEYQNRMNEQNPEEFFKDIA
ncbi:Hypothetical predicted protein [Paramuricea clavata]|uniref:Uncharacterized protein n=1 Tax=Paramuricea clavata TaxID=317549 RepID=A0A6S7I9S2_PARCT|nr:Hypothetical predicted protein [Paramuricea clavata]